MQLTGRRTLLVTIVGMTVAWPPMAGAQSAKPQVGFVNNGSASAFSSLVAAFRRGAAAAGYVDGQNVAIEYRWAEGDNNRLPALVEEFVQKRVAVIAATGGGPTPLAARRAAASIPVVFVIGADPVKLGLVASLNRPGGNMTGVSFLANALLAKQVEVLQEAVGGNATIGFLLNPANPNADADTAAVKEAATKLGRKLVIEKAKSRAEIEAAFATLVRQKIGALLIFPDALFTSARTQLIALASRHRLPALYNSREFAAAGGLIGYGANQVDAYRHAGEYAARILKGEKPADLPVMQSNTVELAINLKTAKALGLEVPQTLLARADEIIE